MRALVWRRSDFRESSRLVTLITRERGRLTALAKGAHRAKSPMLGRIDYLNLLEVRLAGRGGLPILARADLVHEPRRLRVPPRYATASMLCAQFDPAFVDDRPDDDLFDLLVGALTLTERAPQRALAHVALAIELRLLATLGLLPDLTSCGTCGSTGGGRLWASGTEPGLACAKHRDRLARARPFHERAGRWATHLLGTPGRDLPSLRPQPETATGLAVTGAWLQHTVDARPRGRARVVAELLAAAAAAPAAAAAAAVATTRSGDESASNPPADRLQ